MPNGGSRGTLALFFVMGMAFMGILFFMVFPDVLSPIAFHTVPVPAAPSVFNQGPAEELPPALPVEPPTPKATTPKLAAARTTETIYPKRVQPEEPPMPSMETNKIPVAVTPSIPVAIPTKLFPSAVVFRASRGRLLFGRASLLGTRPAEKLIPMDPTCRAMQAKPPTTRFYLVNDEGDLADVVVVVTKGLPHQPWSLVQKPLLVTARNCFFEPYISAIQSGQTVTFQCVDSTLENFHLTPGSGSRYREANFALFPDRPPISLTLDHAEEFLRIKSDLHPWMFAYITIVDHPFFAVTGADGRFQIEGLPSGKYTVTATHRKAGALKADFVIGDDWSKEVDFKFVPNTELAEK